MIVSRGRPQFRRGIRHWHDFSPGHKLSYLAETRETPDAACHRSDPGAEDVPVPLSALPPDPPGAGDPRREDDHLLEVLEVADHPGRPGGLARRGRQPAAPGRP